MHVDRDDRIAARDLGRHQRRQADRPDAEHRKGVARLRLHRIEHRAGAGLAAAGERPEQIERGITAHLHDEALVGDGVGGERRLLEERAVDRRAVLRISVEPSGRVPLIFRSKLFWQCDSIGAGNSGRCRTTETK